MRQIKFRGKRTDNGYWIEGGYVEWSDIRGNKQYQIISSVGHHNDVHPETIGQFTGLFDKNQKEIYEGDIVKYESWKHGSVSEVPDYSFLYKIGFTCLRWACHGIGYSQDMSQVVTLNNDGCIARTLEVVGNIHDNSELLNQ